MSAKAKLAASKQAASAATLKDMKTRPATRALPWALVALIAIAALGSYFALVSGAPLSIDLSWRSLAEVNPGTVGFYVAAFLAEIGSFVGVATCAAIAAAFLLSLRCAREAGQLLTALLLGVALSNGIKYFVGRPRPLDSLYAWDGSSFPSGHSMGAAALAFSIAYIVSAMQADHPATIPPSSVRLVWFAAFAWTLCMMWSRTALGVHWLSDTVAGGLLGLSVAIIAQRIWGRRRPVDTRLGASVEA